MAGLIKRGGIYYASYHVNGKERRKSLETGDLRLAKAKIRKIEDSLDQGGDSPFPTKTLLSEILQEYADHLYAVKRKKNADKDLSCLRHLFGPVCASLQLLNERISVKADRKMRASQPLPIIEIQYFEQLTTAEISRVIDARVRRKGIKGKTANRYREILVRVVNWAMKQRGVRMPNLKNPAAEVERYREAKLQIVFLKKTEIVEQLEGLSHNLQLQVMVAVYIFAGLRREEALWLTTSDLDFSQGDYGTIHIRAKTIAGMSWEPKTKEDRTVPISKTLRGYLDRYVPPRTDDKWLFPSPEKKLWDPDNFSRELRRENARLGLTWGCDEYRHTFASQLAMHGKTLYVISKLMGNSEAVCAKHYARLTPESLQHSVEFMTPPTSQTRHDPEPVRAQVTECTGYEGRRTTLRLVVNNG